MKAKKLVTYRIDVDLVEGLKQQAEKEQRTITAVVQRAIREYIEENKQ
jgi:predicted transcriptional regulator